MTIKEKIAEFSAENRGILATNFYNLETLQGVLLAASETKQPVILQLTQSSIEYMGLNTAVGLGRSCLEEYGVEGWIHLDHGGSVELVQACLEAGFDSVMIDGSEMSFEDNVRITKEVVKRAKAFEAHVEAELGYVAKLGQSHAHQGFTQPEEARRFVEATGIDALAVSIGTAHGFYKEAPQLQFDLLSEISAVTPSSLVLHGSSGLVANQLREAITRGICKVNLATEIKNTFMKSLQNLLQDNEEIDLRKIFPKATLAVSKLVKEKLEIIKNR